MRLNYVGLRILGCVVLEGNSPSHVHQLLESFAEIFKSVDSLLSPTIYFYDCVCENAVISAQEFVRNTLCCAVAFDDEALDQTERILFGALMSVSYGCSFILLEVWSFFAKYFCLFERHATLLLEQVKSLLSPLWPELTAVVDVFAVLLAKQPYWFAH